MSVIIGNKYEIINLIGEGSFGKVFKSKNINTNQDVAIKIQHKGITDVLKHEAKIYKYLSYSFLRRFKFIYLDFS